MIKLAARRFLPNILKSPLNRLDLETKKKMHYKI